MNILDIDDVQRLIKARESVKVLINDLLFAPDLTIQGRKQSMALDRYTTEALDKALYEAVWRVVRENGQQRIVSAEAEMTRLGVTFTPIVLQSDPFEGQQ